MRETVKYLDATRAERLMRAYKEGRPAVRPAVRSGRWRAAV